MDNTPLTDAALEALSIRAAVNGPHSYQTIVPILIAELLRLRQEVRRLAIEQATYEDGSAS
jgi:hypothetical protein